MAVVGSPSYFAQRPRPETPHDLAAHTCINCRSGHAGGLYAWEFERDGRELSVRVRGSFISNDSDLSLDAALKGLGIAILFDYQVADLVASGRLVWMLGDWCPPFPGFYFHYPSRRHTPPALAALIHALRWRD